jgi:hypothetical protein
MVELAGAEIFSRTIFVHEATTEVIWAYSVAVQAVPLPTAAVLVILPLKLKKPFLMIRPLISSPLRLSWRKNLISTLLSLLTVHYPPQKLGLSLSWLVLLLLKSGY